METPLVSNALTRLFISDRLLFRRHRPLNLPFYCEVVENRSAVYKPQIFAGWTPKTFYSSLLSWFSPFVWQRRSDIQQTDQSFKAVNGTGIKILGEAELPVNTSKYQTTVKGLMTEHVSEVLLGIDWLTENNADWNFRDGSVNLNGYRHKLNTRPRGQKWCRRVVVQEDTEVPPRSEQNLGCRVMFHGASKSQPDQRWGTEPAGVLYFLDLENSIDLNLI